MLLEITKELIESAQQGWGNGVVKIGKAFTEKGDFKKVATDHVNDFYGYGESTVLFKPTLTKEIQFRETAEGAVSYFVGGNENFPEDKGFALKPWTNVRFENSAIIIRNNTANAMGNYYYTDVNGDETKVEYTFGYFISETGDLKINIQHSSIPFKG